jgi:pimeloyl-ACP methyl ester carboxylesterase
VIFLHGWLGSWRFWWPTMQQLSQRYRTYAFDLWGYGDSSKLPNLYSFDAYANLLQAFMDEMGIWQASLVGHSLGALVALRFATAEPDRADRVMAGPAPTCRLPRLAARSRGGRAGARPRPAGFPGAARRGRQGRRPGAGASLRACRATTRAAPSRRPACRWCWYGERDPLVPPPDDGWAAGGLAHVRQVLLAESRHFPMLEEGASSPGC